MSSENFVYWLQGFMEIGKPETLDKDQVQEIKNHIALVLKKVTPNINQTYCSPVIDSLDYQLTDERFDFGYQKLDTKHTGVSDVKIC